MPADPAIEAAAREKAMSNGQRVIEGLRQAVEHAQGEHRPAWAPDPAIRAAKAAYGDGCRVHTFPACPDCDGHGENDDCETCGGRGCVHIVHDPMTAAIRAYLAAQPEGATKEQMMERLP